MNTIEEWQEHSKRWENIALGFERLLGQQIEADRKLLGYLMASGIAHHDCPHFSAIGTLLRNLYDAADAVYWIPKGSTVIDSVSPESIGRLMQAVAAIKDYLLKNNFPPLK